MVLPKEIFRSYDIRGIYPTQLNEETAVVIGKALGTFLNKHVVSTIADEAVWWRKHIVVGRDNRESSPAIASNFILGLQSTGCDVTDIGLSITPVIHYLTCTADFDVGVIITASHNPKEYNGFRIDYAKATPFFGKDIETLYSIIERGDFERGSGSVMVKDMFPQYLSYLKSRFKFDRKLKVAIDCGNGTASIFAPYVFSELGLDVSLVYCDSDSEYPHGIPDPESRLFMNSLRAKVVAQNADIGFAFDTDMDRLGVVDDKGIVYENDKLLLLFAEDLLQKNRGATVVFDVKSTAYLESFVMRSGGVPKMLRTGHPYFMNAIKRGALLGGEFSGHTYFGGEYFGFDDGLYAACRIIELIMKKHASLSTMMTKFPKLYHTSEIKLSCSDATKFEVIDELGTALCKLSSGKSVSCVDGVRVSESNTGWYLIRASNTAPIISVRAEGATLSEARAMLELVKERLDKYNLDLSALDNVPLYVS